MKVRELIVELLNADMDSEVKVSLNTKDKGYKEGCDMTPDVEEVLVTDMTTWIRTWAS